MTFKLNVTKYIKLKVFYVVVFYKLKIYNSKYRIGNKYLIKGLLTCGKIKCLVIRSNNKTGSNTTLNWADQRIVNVNI